MRQRVPDLQSAYYYIMGIFLKYTRNESGWNFTL